MNKVFLMKHQKSMYIISVQKEKSNTKPKIKIINISLLYNKNLRHIYSNFCLLYLLYKISAGTDESDSSLKKIIIPQR